MKVLVEEKAETTFKPSDFCERHIYAGNTADGDIVVLQFSGGRYGFVPITNAMRPIPALSKTLRESFVFISGMEVLESASRNGLRIYEFRSTKEFLAWALDTCH